MPLTTRSNPLSSDQLLVDSSGQSNISVQDYAVAMLNELEHPAHIRKRFTVGLASRCTRVLNESLDIVDAVRRQVNLFRAGAVASRTW